MQMFRKTATLVLVGAVIIGSAVNVRAAARSGLDVVHFFAGGSADGASSGAALIQASDGNFYGTTFAGGSFDKGTAFKMTATGVITLLHTFTGGADGQSPLSAVIQASDGFFYGTTYSGGAAGKGTIFRISADGSTFVTLYAFLGGSGSGANPRAALMQAYDGNLYGTTELGGTADRGTAFRLTGTTVTHLYSFTGGLDGAYPYAPLIQANTGFLYGTTYSGDLSTYGRVFKMTTQGAVSVVHTFVSGADGANPVAPLIQTADGNFYGTTTFGGPSNQGTVYRMNAAGDVTVLYSFTAGADGAIPAGALLQSDGDFYGTTKIGGVGTGSAGYGTIFKLSPSGVFTVVHRFTGGADGATPSAALIRAALTGKLYGTTAFGGSVGGVVFRLPLTVAGDFDRDKKSDIAVFRPSNGAWYVRGVSTTIWGGGGDIPVSGDYDGDGKTDPAVYRPSTGVWYVLRSSTATGSVTTWGGGADIPVPGDYDGDDKTDIAVYRPSSGVWYLLLSGTSTGSVSTWGGGADIPVARDFDGDGKTDIAVFRPSSGAWYILQSSTATGSVSTWGGGADIPVASDYDGDGKADVAVFRPSTGVWYILRSSNLTGTVTNWGGGSDIPVPGDFDADGKSDIAVFRPSTGDWFIINSSTGTGAVVTWGGGGDIPVLKRP